MYESIRGILKEKSPTTAIVECSGLSYRLQIPLSTFSHLKDCEKEVALFLSHIVREDSETLYAFLYREERDLFEMLLTVSGIGPKSALAIIGHIELSALKTAVATSDLRLLTKIPGIGKKTAERLVIEMRDKLKKFVSISSSEPLLVTDAISTLVNLGYPLINAQRAVQNAFNENKSTDLSQLIALSLKKV